MNHAIRKLPSMLLSIAIFVMTAESLHAAMPQVTGTRPLVNKFPDRYVGPTPSLTAVANSLGLKFKSLSTLITAAPNAPLSQPVEMSIVYISPAGTPQRINQSYVRSTGNRFLYFDNEGDGKPRRITFDITLTERSSSGAVIPFQFYWHANLDPLFDVSTSPLQFRLIDDCDRWGDSEISLVMNLPDGTSRGASFHLRAGGTWNVNQFVWSRAEASASANLKQPYAMFGENDPSINPAGSPTFLARDMPPLIPAKTLLVRVIERAAFGSSCRAEIKYTLKHSLRRYPYL